MPTKLVLQFELVRHIKSGLPAGLSLGDISSGVLWDQLESADGCWSTPLDPRMPPEKRDNKDHTNGRAIFYAVRPFPWKDKFPKVSRASRELREKTIAKFKNIIPFPRV